MRNQSPEDSPGLAFHLQETQADQEVTERGGQHEGPQGKVCA